MNGDKGSKRLRSRRSENRATKGSRVVPNIVEALSGYEVEPVYPGYREHYTYHRYGPAAIMTSMALDFFGGNRGRRKQAKPQRKNVDGEEPNVKESLEEGNEDGGMKMRRDVEIVSCKESHPDSNHNRIIRNSDKRNIERNKRGFEEEAMEEEEEGGGGGGEEMDTIESQVLKDREVPNGSHLGRRQHIRGAQNLETVLRVNGVVKKKRLLAMNDLGLQQLLLLEREKTNGECSPSLTQGKTPVIVVKSVSDLNGGDGPPEVTEEEKIREYLRRSDTAVIYQEPVEQANVPLSPAAVKALVEADFQKAHPSLQALRDHIETEHPRNLSPNEALSPVQGSYSPAPVPVQGELNHCAPCSVTFSTKDQLEKHELLHSPNTQVSCKVCKKQFANVYRLQRHMISHDESAVLRKFKCPECEKAFKFKHHLKEHIRIHSGEKPFECANCGKRFSHSGSYSSHMTSKKCLIMNLKVNRGRGSVGMDKTQMHRSINGGAKRNVNNNNINSLKGKLNLGGNNLNMAANSPFPSMLPKYSDTAAAAAFLSPVAPRSTFATPSAAGLHPFYMATPPTMHAYNLPALNHFLEQFVTPSGVLMNTRKDREEYKEEKNDENAKEIDVKEENESKEDPEEVKMESVKEEKLDDDKESKDRSSPVSNSGEDFGAVKRILETVNVTVTKQFLQANMQKFTSSPSGSSCASAPSPSLEDKSKGEEIECKHCGKVFHSRIDHHQHERYICENLKSEGLAAKLEEVASVKREESVCSGSEDEDAKECEEEIERNEDGGITITTTTQEGGADGRKVRVRSLIADEQLAILKHHYLINPRPKREELAKIADKIGFPVRVVQVWFQNTRARDRREGRLVQVPYLPLPALFPNNVPLLHSTVSEQPLDLSTKKSQNSSPESSPQRSSNDSDVINLSHKSNSPGSPHIFPNGLTIRAMSNLQQFQHSSASSLADFRRTPSPLAYLNLHQEDLKNTGSRLARILTQPSSLSQRLDANGVTLVPMDRLVFNQDLQNSGSPLPMVALSLLSQENGGRACSSSPGSDKRSWVQGDLTDETEDSRPRESDQVDEFGPRMKKAKLSQDSDQEVEGQFICDQCEKAFSKQSSLARHKYEHSGQRPHKCEVCEKAFKHKHHLTEHKRLHSGEKPFQCGKCLKRFSHSGSYSQHMNHRYSYCKPYRD